MMDNLGDYYGFYILRLTPFLSSLYSTFDPFSVFYEHNNPLRGAKSARSQVLDLGMECMFDYVVLFLTILGVV